MNEQLIGRNRRLRNNIAKRTTAQPIIAIQNIEMRKLILSLFNRKVRINGSAAMQATHGSIEHFFVFFIMPLGHLHLNIN